MSHPVLHARFPRFDAGGSSVPIQCLTPDRGGCIVRFFDTPAVSPGGGRVACFRLPFEDRLPVAGDAGEVVVIDLATGVERVVAETRGWEPQLGAQVQWGADDRTLFFSDVEPRDWTPRAVRLDPETGDSVLFNAPLYHASPDGRWLIGTNPVQMRSTQTGYGVVVPEEAVPERVGAPGDDGVWLTDARTGEKRLVYALSEVARRFAGDLGMERPGDWRVFAFHTKFAPTGGRILFSLRWFRAAYDGSAEPIHDKPNSDLRFAVFTSERDGSDLRLAVGPDAWVHGGHHINFTPDGKRLTMNLGGLGGPDVPPTELRFASVDARGGPITALLPGAVGSGHPTLHPDGRHLLTDCYFHERWTDQAAGTTPLRWLDVETGAEQHLARIPTRSPHPHPTLRIDPHPCWDRSNRFVTFTATPDGTRRVFLADLSALIG